MKAIRSGGVPANHSRSATGRGLLRLAALTLGAFACVSGFANDFTITPNTNGGFGHYFWSIQTDDAPADSNPDLTLRVGLTYTFTANTSAAHPFFIKTIQEAAGAAGAYPTGASSGLDHNGVTSSATVMTFTVPASALGTLYYNCGNHAEMTGTITVIDSVFSDGFEVPTP